MIYDREAASSSMGCIIREDDVAPSPIHSEPQDRRPELWGKGGILDAGQLLPLAPNQQTIFCAVPNFI
jgi:hypothetical protein